MEKLGDSKEEYVKKDRSQHTHLSYSCACRERVRLLTSTLERSTKAILEVPMLFTALFLKLPCGEDPVSTKPSY